MSYKINIWNRDLELEISYEIVSEAGITDSQRKNFELFKSIEKCKLENPDDMISFCKKNDNDKIKDNIDNIFKYVMPREILIGEKRVSILCDYRYDMDDRIAIVFENNIFIKICKEDELY